MLKSTNSERLIIKLLKQLADAVRAGSRAHAMRLAGVILKKYAKNRPRLKRQVLALMAKLDRASTAKPSAVAIPAAKTKSKIGAATKAKISVTAKVRWAKVKAAKTDSAARSLKKLANRVNKNPRAEITYDIEDFINPSVPFITINDSRSSVTAGEVYPVWFATDRAPTASGDGFTGQRHPQKKITRGRVNVFIPEAHRFGETGTPFWKKLLRFDLRDDKLRIQRLELQGWNVFFREIQQAMRVARETGETSHALVFLHGFNVPFEDAAIRAAQMGCDLKVPGATAFFSWPSRGSEAYYAADEASIEASEQAITDFLVDFAANCGAEKVHVIAHSMGNRGLLRAMQRIAANSETRSKVKFGQIFLAAPDVDHDVFLDLARIYSQFAERTTLYASDGDKAVWLSKIVHAAPRAGYFKPYTVVQGVDTITVPNFNIDFLGHSYFAQAEALLYDIRDLMLNGKAPAQRQRIKPADFEGAPFWELKK